ncbi:hypothetical protein F5Y02DRAFT_38778 [Annulohypoxylon stygium]|nr:hypothetical protein F5Y02DRAFT_38778 [Annulohypoxylon stygium]
MQCLLAETTLVQRISGWLVKYCTIFRHLSIWLSSIGLLFCCCPLPRIFSSQNLHKIGALTYPNVATTVSSSKRGPAYILAASYQIGILSSSVRVTPAPAQWSRDLDPTGSRCRDKPHSFEYLQKNSTIVVLIDIFTDQTFARSRNLGYLVFRRLIFISSDDKRNQHI